MLIESIHGFHQLAVPESRLSARGVARMHGGRIEAHGAGRGGGAEFSRRLPAPGEEPSTDPASAEAEEDLAHAGALRVLAVDDNADAVESLAMLLDVMGFKVEIARDGLEAIAAAERFRPGLVLLDIGMPSLDGYGACRRIREQPWGKGMVIVALSGWGREEDRRQSRDAGFDAHLIKPIDPATLRRLLAAPGALRSYGTGDSAHEQPGRF